MSDYQVIARKYRPRSFKEVLGQEAIVTTLKNAIKFKRMAHAYLFCGSRGTGKTTLARIFAKALNCQQPSDDGEPCSLCPSCREIAAGSSLDVLEVDGASNRGIDDIRQINETVGYASSSGKYKIYIIDEVHMLTKEAFNALLKTLEEPPPKVVFLFATTEPHKVLPTILSRCQRFNLNRIPTEIIVNKLEMIAKDQKLEVEPEAFHLIANMADGGLRDAESLFDQIIAFHEGQITAESVSSILGVMQRDCFFEIDRAGKEGRLSVAFEIAHRVFSQGKDLTHFIEGLVEHFRNLIMIKLMGTEAPLLAVSPADKSKYEASARLYSQEQCLANLDILIEAQNQIRFMPSGRIALEAILLRVMRSHQRLPIEVLVRRLSELEQALCEQSQTTPPETTPPGSARLSMPMTPPQQPQQQTQPQPLQAIQPPPVQAPVIPIASPAKPAEAAPKPIISSEGSLSEDPTPTPADLGIKMKAPAPPKIAKVENVVTPSAPIELGARPTEEAKRATTKQQSKHDTLMHFAAVELEGTIKKTSTAKS